MLPVYLLEDNQEQQIQYAKIIRSAISDNHMDMELICQTLSPLELLSVAQESDSNYGLFFLDMEINNNTHAGLQLAVEIRHLLPQAKIVFISIHDELAVMTIERRVAPLDFIDKDHGLDSVETKIREDLHLAVVDYQAIEQPQQRMFSYRIGSRYFTVPLDQVLYLTTAEVAAGHVLLHTKTRETEFLGSLNNLAHRYQELFRSDKSYLVNLQQPCKYDNKTKQLKFQDGSSAYVSLRRARELIKYLR